MKKVYIIIILIINCFVIAAQSPEAFTYQAIVRNAGNEPIVSQNVSLKFSILKGSAIGQVIYEEKHNTSTNSLGLVNIELGNGIEKVGSLSLIDWSIDKYFIKTEVDPAGGSNYMFMGTTQFLSVPYALFAKQSGNTNRHYVGELFGGGIVFWVSPDGQHGLILSLSNVGQSAWSNITNSEVNTYSLYEGLSNSNSIINQPGHTNSAAKICLDYTYNGYDDWFLPSYWQLLNVLDNIYTINYVLVNDNNPESVPLSSDQRDYTSIFWSSTENDPSSALAIHLNFTPTNNPQTTKASVIYIRAIRSF